MIYMLCYVIHNYYLFLIYKGKSFKYIFVLSLLILSNIVVQV